MSEETKPLETGFAVLKLTDLKIIRFAFKDEMLAAIKTFENQDIPFIALIYGSGQWRQPEIHR